MFNSIVEEISKRFSLGNNASPFLQMVLAFITNRDSGGISGFLDLFRKAGMSDVVNSWVGSGSNAKQISPSQVDSVLGNSGLLAALASRFGVDGSTVSSTLAYALPLVISKLTSGGTIPSSLPAEVTSFIGPAGTWLTGLRGAATNGAAAVGNAAKAGGAGIMRWLPWVIGLALLLWFISMCGKKQETPQVSAPPPATAPAPVPEPAAAPATPPAAKIYFEVDKTELPKDVTDTLKPIVTYLTAKAASKATISGYHDPSGNSAQNEELAKNRAKAVRDSLKATGIAEDRIVMQKPAKTTGGGNEAEARRVEVDIQQ